MSLEMPAEEEAQRIYFEWIDHILQKSLEPMGGVSHGQDADGHFVTYLGVDQRVSLIRGFAHHRARVPMEVQIYEDWFDATGDDDLPWKIAPKRYNLAMRAFLRAHAAQHPD